LIENAKRHLRCVFDLDLCRVLCEILEICKVLFMIPEKNDNNNQIHPDVALKTTEYI
jgi:hypothetical protein